MINIDNYFDASTEEEYLKEFGYSLDDINEGEVMTAEERLLDAGYDDILFFKKYSYDDALIGVSHDGRAIYDYEKMIEWLMKKEGWTDDEAVEWIEFNTVRAIPYFGEGAPIIMYPLAYM